MENITKRNNDLELVIKVERYWQDLIDKLTILEVSNEKEGYIDMKSQYEDYFKDYFPDLMEINLFFKTEFPKEPLKDLVLMLKVTTDFKINTLEVSKKLLMDFQTLISLSLRSWISQESEKKNITLIALLINQLLSFPEGCDNISSINIYYQGRRKINMSYKQIIKDVGALISLLDKDGSQMKINNVLS